MMGYEQELFFVSREAYLKRMDLQMTGRTIIGRRGHKGQKMKSHYMAPISLASPVMACMQEIQEQCFHLGIPLKARHREVAPNQYEFTPLYGTVTSAVDQNLLVMQIIEETAIRHGLTALLQEKPFAGYNGSGKHNNWSVSTEDGTNLFNYEELCNKTKDPELFAVIMAAIVKAVDEYGDLMRLSIATPGNDLRLGGFEAPSYIVTLSLGDSLTEYLRRFMNGSTEIYKPESRVFDMGALAIPPIEVPAEDRNRSAFFAFGGNRFEFRAAGSSQNLSLINCVLGTITARIFKDFADQIENGKTAREVAQQALRESFKVIFNGNNYDPKIREAQKSQGLWAIESSVDALCRFTAAKNVSLFESMKVFTAEECHAQQTLLLEHYIGTVEIEANCLIDIINQFIIPSCKRCNRGPIPELLASVSTLKESLQALKAEPDLATRAELSRELRLEIMVDVRKICDSAEAEVPEEKWLLATYKELLYIDENYDAL